MAEFVKDEPFSHDPFYNELLEKWSQIETKLYGPMKFAPIARDPAEIDFNLGQVHETEVDFKKFSKVMDEMNAKWGTLITYCVYTTTQYPKDMLINIRGPKAPRSLRQDIKFSSEEITKAAQGTKFSGAKPAEAAQ